jgi:uncharacterized protein (TIGR03437 family)
MASERTGWAFFIVCAACGAAVAQNPATPVLSATFNAPATFATHAQLASYGFSWGPSDGHFGAIPSGTGNYTFYATAGSSATCAGTPNAAGVYTFSGTLNGLTGSPCKRLFGPGDGPAGWVFDKNYAGGGQVLPFSSGGKTGYLMSFHGEYQWSTQGTPNHLCYNVPCFYSGLGLAVSLDGGKTFQIAGQIFQPVQPLSAFLGSTSNYGPGYGSLIVADVNGKHLDNPPPDPTSAYFYLFFADWEPSLPGSCAYWNCMGVARAKYSDVIAAATSGNPNQVATVFKKYDGASPDPWTQPATSNTPGLSSTSGSFAPLWTNQFGDDGVIYDKALDLYIAVLQDNDNNALWLRASSDLLHWSEPFAMYTQPGRELWYPMLVGETGDPTIGGPALRIYYSNFPAKQFPDWTLATLEEVTVSFSTHPPPPFLRTSVSPGNGATYNQGGLVSGSWAQVQGFNLSSTTRKWQASDFTGLGDNLPTNLDGSQVKVNGVPAAIYYISSDQINLQVPVGISGTASVQVVASNGSSNIATGSAVSNSPGIFPIVENGVVYPATVFNSDGRLVGASSIGPAFRPARPGEHVQLYATGLAPSPAGVIVGVQYLSGAAVAIGTITIQADATALVAPGEFQINFTVPQLADGNYPISIQIDGASSPLDIASNPALSFVFPIHH